MAYFDIQDEFLPQRWKQFHYYATGSAVTSAINHDLNFSVPWKLCEIRLHFSSQMGSAKYFNVYISSVNGSQFNTNLYSLNLNGSQDVFLHYSDPLLFGSDDQLRIVASVLSVANAYGLEAIGWAVSG